MVYQAQITYQIQTQRKNDWMKREKEGGGGGVGSSLVSSLEEVEAP